MRHSCLHPKVPYQPHDHAGKCQQRNTPSRGVHYKATNDSRPPTPYMCSCSSEAGGRGDPLRSGVDAAPPAACGVRRVARRGRGARRYPTPLLDWQKRHSVLVLFASLNNRRRVVFYLDRLTDRQTHRRHRLACRLCRNFRLLRQPSAVLSIRPPPRRRRRRDPRPPVTRAACGPGPACHRVPTSWTHGPHLPCPLLSDAEGVFFGVGFPRRAAVPG